MNIIDYAASTLNQTPPRPLQNLTGQRPCVSRKITLIQSRLQRFSFSLNKLLGVIVFLIATASVAATPTATPADSSGTPPSHSASTTSQSSASIAKIAGFTISADDIARDLEKNQIEMSGHVQIIYQNQHFSADKVVINMKKKQAQFFGHVRIQSLDSEIAGDEIHLDYLSNQALIFNGYVQSNNVRFQGQVIEQQGLNQFYVVDADYTTCTNCPSTWSFEGSHIKAELGGYAFLKNTFLKVSNVPVLWLPYLVVPLKNERQSGLLAPEFGYIRNRRLVFTQSFFWAKSRSDDMTFTFKNYELGGLKTLVEYRYVLTPNSFGQINVAHLNDTEFKSESRYNHFLLPEEKNRSFRRWSAQGYSQHELSDETLARLKINQISDLQYPKDFYDEFKNYAESGLENRINISRKTEHTLTQFDAIYYKHLLEANPLASNENAVHKLPELRFDSTLKTMDDLPFFYSFSGQYDQFYRQRKWDDISTNGSQKYVTNGANDPSCDNKLGTNCNPVFDGQFDPNNDILRTGQRLIFKGTLSTKTFTPFDLFQVSPQVSYNESHYFFPTGDSRYNARRYTQFDITSRSRLYNVYQADPTADKFKHEFIPELQYLWIPHLDQESHPFFGQSGNGEAPFSSKNLLSDSDLNSRYGIQYDFKDRIYDHHLITLSLLNRLIKKRTADNAYKNILDFRLSQSYDLYQAQSGGENHGQPLSDLSGTLNLNIDEYTLSNQFNYYPYLAATNSTTSLSYLNSKQQYYRIGYISKRTEDPKTDDVSLSVGFVTKYVNILSGFIFDTSENNQNSSRLKQFSLITQLKPPGECWAINFYREQKVGLEAEWHVRFDFSFDGKPPKVIPPQELNIQ